MSQEETLSLAQRLKDARAASGVTPSELSERGHISRQEVYDCENGNRAPSQRVIEAYVSTCGLKGLFADSLFLDADKAPPDVFKFLKAHPEWCEILRAELLLEGG